MSGYRQFNSEDELRKEFTQHWKDPDNQPMIAEYIFNSIFEDVLFDTVIEVHYQNKRESWTALEGIKEEIKP